MAFRQKCFIHYSKYIMSIFISLWTFMLFANQAFGQPHEIAARGRNVSDEVSGTYYLHQPGTEMQGVFGHLERFYYRPFQIGNKKDESRQSNYGVLYVQPLKLGLSEEELGLVDYGWRSLLGGLLFKALALLSKESTTFSSASDTFDILGDILIVAGGVAIIIGIVKESGHSIKNDPFLYPLDSYRKEISFRGFGSMFSVAVRF